ncbi:MAG: hypothetical protein R6U57_01935 [Anaerolineales bacterium]
MNNHKHLVFPLILCVLAALACEESGKITSTPSTGLKTSPSPSQNAKPNGDRTLEIHINEAENGDYDQAVEKSKAAGAESVSLSVFWDEIETTPGVYQPDPNYLEIANLYYPPQQLAVSLVISVLDTTQTRLPPDLEGKPLDDPKVISRFKGLLEYTATQIPDLQLTSLAIGNEIDGVLGEDQEAWQAYRTFFRETSQYARRLWPEVPVGTKITFGGLAGPMRETARILNQECDVVMVTYYPLAGDFTVHDPEVVHEDLNQLVRTYPQKKIYITEIGYPTGAANDSSPEKQAAFIRETFAAWDQHADHIPVLSYSWLTDLPPSAVSNLERYYGVSTPAFGEFLRTLGLRTYPDGGKDKPGYRALKAEAKARGW